MESSHTKLLVFFDGGCRVCTREASHYAKKDKDQRLELINIANPLFDATAYGLDPINVQKVMHAILPDGKTVTAVRAFIEIWKRLPRHLWLARIFSMPVIYHLAYVGYRIFAKIRKFLPSRTVTSCTFESKPR